MAVSYSVSFSNLYPSLAWYYEYAELVWTWEYQGVGYWDRHNFMPPQWNSGAKKFAGYYKGSTQKIDSNGWILANNLFENESWTERWTGIPIAILKNGSNILGEIDYDDGMWYKDYKAKIPLDSYNPIENLPSKDGFKFLGFFASNSSTSTKYIDENGRPTSALLNLHPTSDLTMYAVLEESTKKITVSASNGTWETKTFYQRIADGQYCKNSDGSSIITGITVPERECYRWDGLHKSSSSSSDIYANPDGTFTSAFLSRSVAATTVYGNFWSLCAYKISLNLASGYTDKTAYYQSTSSSGILTHWLGTQTIDKLPIPSRTGYHFLGYFSTSSSTGGTQYVLADGTIQSALKSIGKNITIYARWRKASAQITLNASGGKGGITTLYYDETDGVYFDTNSQPVVKLSQLPVYTGNIFAGYYDSENGGTKVIDTDGTIVATSPSSDAIWYTRWIIGKSIIHVDKVGGDGGTDIFYFDKNSRIYYADEDLTQQISSITLPYMYCQDAAGAYDSNGTIVVDEYGSIKSSYNPTLEDEYITVTYARRCYAIALDPVGGQSDIPVVYWDNIGFYSDEYKTHPITTVQTFKTGHTFQGYIYGTTVVIDSNGTILNVAKTFFDDYTATAQWTLNTYKLTFVSLGSVIQEKQIGYGGSIGKLPTPTWKGHRFMYWAIDGIQLYANTKYSWDTDITAIAKWEEPWGFVQDYWGLGSATLIPIKSDEGTAGQMIYTADGGSAQYQVLPNPSVTYMVIGQTDFNCTLGGLGLGAYMITNVQVNTNLAQPPTITVSGVANEGNRAVNQYPVRVSISPRHRAQRLDNSIVGGGELQRCTYTAKCDPVVVYGTKSSGIAPIASDVVHGVVTIQGTTAAYNMETAPTASNGYTATELSEDGDHIGYKTFNISVEKRI